MEVVNVVVTDSPEVVAVNVAVGFGTVVNSDSTYSATVNSGDTLVVPDTTWTDSDGTPMTSPATLPIVCTPPVTLGVDIVNSDLTLNDHANDGDTYVVADITVTEPDASTYTYPAAKDITLPDNRNAYFYFIATYDDYQLITVDSNAATTWTTETLTNVATIAYEKNSVAASLPITLAVGDTLKITITRTNAALDSLVKLNN